MDETRRRLAEKWAVVVICFALAACYVAGEIWRRWVSFGVVFWISLAIAGLQVVYHVRRRGVVRELRAALAWLRSPELREWLVWFADPRFWKNWRGRR